MGILRTLRDKPWEHPATAGGAPAWTPDPDASARTALRFFLALVGVLFFLFTITFLSRSQYPDFVALSGAPWQPFTDPTRLWFNTALLVCASLGMQIASINARRGRMQAAAIGVAAGALFTVLFLLAQFDLWLHLRAMGFYMHSNPASSYFYLLTAVHGLHLLGGLVVLANVGFRVWYDQSPASLKAPVALCTTYWHFLLVVWLLLFGLLASSADTINTLAALCGF